MGLFSNFFGGAESKSKVVQNPNWNAEQQATFNDLYAQIKAAGTGPAPTSPDAYVPQTEQDKQYLSYANSDAVKKMATGEVPYDVGPEWANNYFENSVRPVAMREWNQFTKPGIEEAYAGSTFNSTGRLDAIQKATENLGTNLTAQKAGLQYQEELARRQAIENAQSRIGVGLNASGAAATYARAIETEKVMNAVQKYLMGESVDGQYNPAYNPMVTLAFNLLGLKPFTSNVETKSEGAGLGYTTIGTGLNFLAGGAMNSGGGGSATPSGNSISSMSGSGGESGYRAAVGGYGDYSSVGTGVGLFGGSGTAATGAAAATTSELPWYLF